MVFKGGASLSKGYGLINRFSEDVDIAIIIGQKNQVMKSRLSSARLKRK
jgi:predicted nucleotidyltransferase component of viral defense system